METIKQVLMRRDGMTAEEAEMQIADAKETLEYYLSIQSCRAEDICSEFFGLEADYIDELL